MRATSKPRSALDEEVGPSDLDFLNLTDYQALCLSTRAVFPEVRVLTLPRNGECSALDVGNARGSPWDPSSNLHEKAYCEYIDT